MGHSLRHFSIIGLILIFTTVVRAQDGAPPQAGVEPAAPVSEGSKQIRMKDPFMIPNKLFETLRDRDLAAQAPPPEESVAPKDRTIDDSVDPKVRWPLAQYRLAGIISGVANPRVSVVDPAGKHHTYFVKSKIGNADGVITAIKNGEVTVSEGGTEIKLRVGR